MFRAVGLKFRQSTTASNTVGRDSLRSKCLEKFLIFLFLIFRNFWGGTKSHQQRQ